jgi:hypothetical protein
MFSGQCSPAANFLSESRSLRASFVRVDRRLKALAREPQALCRNRAFDAAALCLFAAFTARLAA